MKDIVFKQELKKKTCIDSLTGINPKHLTETELIVYKLRKKGLSITQIAKEMNLERNKVSTIMQTMKNATRISEKIAFDFSFVLDMSEKEKERIRKIAGDKGIIYIEALSSGKCRNCKTAREIAGLSEEEGNAIQTKLRYIKHKKDLSKKKREITCTEEKHIPPEFIPIAHYNNCVYISKDGDVYTRQKNNTYIKKEKDKVTPKIYFYNHEGKLRNAVLKQALGYAFFNATNKDRVICVDGNEDNVTLENLRLEKKGQSLLKARGIEKRTLNIKEKELAYSATYDLYAEKNGNIYKKQDDLFVPVSVFLTNGSQTICLKHYNVYARKVIADAFCSNPNNFQYVCSKNNTDDIQAENLLWVETKQWKKTNERIMKINYEHASESLRKIIDLHNKGFGFQSISKQLKMPVSAIKRIIISNLEGL